MYQVSLRSLYHDVCETLSNFHTIDLFIVDLKSEFLFQMPWDLRLASLVTEHNVRLTVTEAYYKLYGENAIERRFSGTGQ